LSDATVKICVTLIITLKRKTTGQNYKFRRVLFMNRKQKQIGLLPNNFIFSLL
jgi:hypothetical protein